MCGSGGVTRRPGDPGDGASSWPGPAQIPREPGSRPRVPRPRVQSGLLVRPGGGRGQRRDRGPVSRTAVPGGLGSGVRMQTPRWRAGAGGPGRVPEGQASGEGAGRLFAGLSEDVWESLGPGERPAAG